MWGPVYDEKAGTLQLCSLVRVHPGIAHWMQHLISVAAVLQFEAAPLIADAFVSFLGQASSVWQEEEFNAICESHMQVPLALFASAGGSGGPLNFYLAR